MEDHWDSNSLTSFDWDESSSNSISPDFSPVDSQSEFPPTPEQVQCPNLSPPEIIALHTNPYLAASPSISPYSEYAVQQIPSYIVPSNYGYAKYPSVPPVVAQKSSTPDISQNINHQFSSATPMHHRQPRNKATAAYLSADGMSPFSINLNALANPSAQVQPPFTLRIRLCVPTMNDSRTPPTLHGFLGGIALDHVWSASCRCITKVYENNCCVSEETGFLNISHINMGTVNTALPESPLSRCRWLDACTRDTFNYLSISNFFYSSQCRSDSRICCRRRNPTPDHLRTRQEERFYAVSSTPRLSKVQGIR
jgi:hypothetical protein